MTDLRKIMGFYLPDQTIEDRGVFGGGQNTAPAPSNVLDYITISTPGNATDFGDLIVAKGELAANSNGSSQKGVFVGGGSASNVMEYITINSEGNASDFGDLTVGRYRLSANSNGNNNRGIIGGGDTNETNVTNIIDYITISTPGNATDFGDLTLARMYLSATSNGALERGVFGGGYKSGAPVEVNIIDYITISSTGNATDFGDLTMKIYGLAATSNGSNGRGVFGGGQFDGTDYNVISYISINSTGNATDFGDLTAVRKFLSATSNGTNQRGVFGGGDATTNVIGYITINSTGNATDFGDLTEARRFLSATSNA
jgi:hypothetical protein